MRGRILILENSPANLDVLRQVLTDAGHETATIADTSQALHHVTTGRADLLIAATAVASDAVLDLLRQVKSAAPEVPVLLLTEPTGAFQASEAAQQGAFGYLSTPIDGEQLRLLVLRALEFGHLLRENRALRGDGGALAGRPLAEIEKQVILSTLERFKGHRLRTATALGIGLRTLGMKLKRWKDEGQLMESRG